MAIFYLAYTAISRNKRTAGGHQQLVTLRSKLLDPTLTDQQRTDIQTQINNINSWMDGSMAVVAPNVPDYSTQ